MRWELVRCFAKAQSLMRLTVCWRILTSGAWERVLLKAENEHAIQAPVDAVRGKRGERTMVEKCPKYSRQSNGAVESAVRGIQSLTRTYVCVAREPCLQGRQQEHCLAAACWARGVRAQSICET